jgi:sodium-dependent phosphate cotransporter
MVLILAFVLLFISIKWLAQLIYQLFIGRFRSNFQHLVFSNRWRAFGWGVALTAAVQSSSVTTPLVVPLVATGKLRVKNCFPYIIGANMGTTITALIAALFHSQAAMSIALAHVLFNLAGAVLFLPETPLSKIPVKLANGLGKLTANNRLVGFAFILLTFFLIPFILIYLTQV